MSVRASRKFLYHGTRHAHGVLAARVLWPSPPDRVHLLGGRTPGGDLPHVCFSRSRDVARYWTTIVRSRFYCDDEGRGAVLMFDRKRLATKYVLVHNRDPMRVIDEREMRIYETPVELDGVLIDVEWMTIA